MSFFVHKDKKFKDSKGTPIWFPKDGRSYHDRALNKTFHSIKQKAEYMKEKGLIMDGSVGRSKRPIEAGDTRNKSFRKEHGMED